MTGADRVARLVAGVFAKFKPAGVRMVRVEVDGQPGAKFVDSSDRVVAVWSLDAAEGRV